MISIWSDPRVPIARDTAMVTNFWAIFNLHSVYLHPQTDWKKFNTVVCINGDDNPSK